MIKLFLYMIILTGGAGVGYLKARPYENRVMHLDDLILTLKTMESEMEYRSDPLPTLLERIGSKSKDKSGEFLTSLLRLLVDNERLDFYESWKMAVWKVYDGSSLNSEDMDILSKAGIELGKTDMENQKAMFAHLFSGLERQRKDAAEERRIKTKLYRTLGAASGALAVIMLL